MSVSPWVQPREDPQNIRDVAAPPRQPAVDLVRPLRPQPAAVTAGPCALPSRQLGRAERVASVWWLGAHGGAGESTLEQLLEGSRAANHRWPVAAAGTPRASVVLVARTSAAGLRAAQRAITQWAAGGAAVDLRGLVLVADAPGRLPRPLRDLAQLVCGGVRSVWHVPWVEAWRVGAPVSSQTAPRSVLRVLEQLGPAHVPSVVPAVSANRVEKESVSPWSRP